VTIGSVPRPETKIRQCRDLNLMRVKKIRHFSARNQNDPTRPIVTPHDANSPDPESTSEHEHSPQVAGAPESSPPAHGPLISKSAALAYISKKLDPQRSWFDQNAQRSKLFHYSLLGTSMVATASIVVANSVHLAAGLSLVTAVGVSIFGIVPCSLSKRLSKHLRPLCTAAH
jgi:hypothetical protein